MTPKTVEIAQAGKRLTKLVLDVEHGTPVYLTRGKRPVAEIVPLKRRVLGLHRGNSKCAADFDAELPAAYLTGE